MVATIIRNKIYGIENGRGKLFWFLFSIFILLLLTYGFCVRSAIINSIEREALERHISSMSGEINDLEFTYLKSKNTITIELASSLGFSESKKKIFVERKPLSNGLSLNLNEM